MNLKLLRQIVLMSKMTFYGLCLQCFLFSLSMANDGHAQKKKLNEIYLSVKFNEASVSNVIRKLEKETDFSFSYFKEDIPLKKVVSLNANNISMRDLLKEVSKQTRINFKRIDENIYLLPKSDNQTNEVEEIINDELLQQVRITGKVTSAEDGEPLPGVSIIVKGTATGTTTNFDGEFSISVNSNDVLVFSFIGYKTFEIEVNNQTVIDVSLEMDLEQLEEVVVVGYGTAKRKDITGSIVSKNLENSPEANLPTTNVLQNMRGMGGVNVGIQNSPGSNPSIIIRGQNSINGSNSPLIVLDGIIYLGNLSYINPQDIATIDVLKDASATAVYGSRAANGVIVITTKKGKTGKPIISYNASAGVNTWQNKFDMMGLERYKEKYAAQQELASVDDIIFDDETSNEYLAQGVDTDWMDLISRNGFFQDHQISVSGSADRFNYYFSGGYNNSKGVIVGDNFERIAVSSKLDANITDWLQVGIDGAYNRADYSGISASVPLATESTPFSYPYRYDGMPFNVNQANSTQLERWPKSQSVQNPLWGTDGTIDDVNVNNFFRLATYANIDIPQIEGLSYRLNYAIYTNIRNQNRFTYEDYYIQEASSGYYIERYDDAEIQKLLSQANGYNATRVDYNYVVDNIVSYKKQLGNHFFNATLVATRDFTSIKESRINGNDFSVAGNTSLGFEGIQKANNLIYTNNLSERANIGYLGRLSYTYNDKYSLTGSVRRDGASVFGQDRKWGTFSSVGVSWTLSEEEFLSGNNIIDYLKVKASYGKNGNQGVDPYSTLARVSSGSDGGIRYEFGDNPSNVLYGIALSNLANDALGWEETTSFNGGFSSALFKSRVFLDLDFYFSKTTDQIFTRGIPIMTGFSSIITSLGQVNNRGYEINLRTVNIEKNDFSWESSIVLWKNRNIVESLYGDDNDGDGVEDDDIANSLFIGKSLGAIYGYEYIGVVQEDDTDYIENTGAVPGDPMFRDLNGDGLIDADNDRKVLGFRKPNASLNISNTLRYKNFTFYTLITSIMGGGKDNFYLRENPLHNSFRSRFDTNEVDHDWWTPENQSSEYLRPNYVGNRYLGLQSRGFVRIQDVSLSYKLPQNVIDKLGLQRLEVFGSARNLYVFSGWFGGGDPEFESEDGNTIGIRPFDNVNPVPTTFTFGLKSSF
ncbi:SusC/RagA family TonB-linked outer membrane protein [Chondrinema litorale]|uniref:SusC/RagA family TonB-linked outer membrane protein n=1 Tax=Chondrinema litorale TaxID=2994555 RepID=UPI002543D959|nr:TonB-dependent receptor [Chondrinema litorale]UZR98967.1 TonB-dependent receptor [Chondrinema litorale]